MGTTCPLQSIPPHRPLLPPMVHPSPQRFCRGTENLGIWARMSKMVLGKKIKNNKKRKEQALFCAEPKFHYRPRLCCGAGEGTGAGWGGGSAPLGASRKMCPNFGQEPSRTLPGMAESPLQPLCPQPAAPFPLWMRFGTGAGPPPPVSHHRPRWRRHGEARSERTGPKLGKLNVPPWSIGFCLRSSRPTRDSLLPPLVFSWGLGPRDPKTRQPRHRLRGATQRTRGAAAGRKREAVILLGKKK